MENIPEFVGNHLFLVTLLIAVLLLLLWNIYGDAMSGVQQIGPAELTRLINHENAAVIDIRNAQDFNNGHIIHSRNFPEAEIGSREKEMEKFRSKVVVLCCSSGLNSGRVARKLKTSGFEKIYSLKGGIQAWQNATLPLTTEK